jgi:threonine/homoserine/homoserine lactone efflux protein
MTELIAFLGVSALVIVTPGQDTALTLRNTLRGNRAAGVYTALGISSGQTVWTIATSAGLAGLLVASEPAFVALKLAGAAYLVYLGLQAVRSSLWPAASTQHAFARDARAGAGRASAFRQGILSNLGNPKMAVFFTSLLPQFGDSFGALLLLGLVFAGMTLLWLTLYAAAVARASGFLRRPAIRRLIDAATGVVLVALGLRLATEQRR